MSVAMASSTSKKTPNQGAVALQLAIKQKGLDQSKAAALLGVLPPTLSRWLSTYRVPNAHFAARIESTFDVSAALWGTPPFDEPKRTGTEG